MSCRRHRRALMAFARQVGEPEGIGRARAHLDICAACRRWLDEQQAMTAALRALATASRDEQPSEALESDLMAAFHAEATARAAAGEPVAARPVAWLRWWPAAAAVVLAVGALAWWQIAGGSVSNERASVDSAVGIPECLEFAPLPLAFTLPAFERGEIVRTQIAVAALPVYGIAIPPDPVAPAVTVDLLVGQDGHPRAIRLVTSESQDSRSRR